MNALVSEAKKEGQLNVITLPSNWANYGTIMSDFSAKYTSTSPTRTPTVPARTS